MPEVLREYLGAQHIPPDAPEEVMSAWQHDRLRRLAREKLTRACEALKLYRPLPHQEDFHACRASEAIIRGGTRSGKTLPCLVEIARAVTGQDPHGKYPPRDGTAVIVCEKLDRVGRIAYEQLFRPGAFRIIRDKTTGCWRSYVREDEPERFEESKPCPPLIPNRFLAKKISFLNAGQRIFRLATFITGWQLLAYSSEADPIQGFNVHLAHVDEDVQNQEWVPELESRVSAVGGRIIWSAMPHSRNMALRNLSRRAQDGDPDVAEFRSRFSDNPHVDTAERARWRKAWAAHGDDTLLRRDDGDFLDDEYKVFPEFNWHVHGIEKHQLPDGQIPRDWCRFVAIDPGIRTLAVLFAAIPPPGPERRDQVVVYDELYLKNCDNAMFGRAMAEKAKGQTFQAFIIDAHGSASRERTNGKTIRQQMSEALRDNHVESIATRNGFILGSDDKAGRILRVHDWLGIREDGTTKLLFVHERLPNFAMEMDRYMRRRIKGKDGHEYVSDEPDDRAGLPNHLMQSLQYLCHCSAVRYVAPRPPKKSGRSWSKYIKNKRRKKQKREGGSYINLGPGQAA